MVRGVTQVESIGLGDWFNDAGALGPFFRVHHMLGHKISFNKFKDIEIIASIFSTFFTTMQ